MSISASFAATGVLAGQTVDVTAVVSGTSNKSVQWSVCDGTGANCALGGNSLRGTILQIGTDSMGNSIARYTAPTTAPAPPDCRMETEGCSVVLQAELVAFGGACFARVKISNPVPAITSLMPTSTLVGGAGFTLTVEGSNFIPSSVVRWNSSNRITTFISSTQLQATIPASDIALTGTAGVTVFNPPPGGGTSNIAAFTIDNAVPVITNLTPSSALVGGAGFTLTVEGSNFIPSSVVRWNGSNRTTTFINSTQLQAAIPASDIAVTGTTGVTVFNPPPGGGTSNIAVFNINNPAPILTALNPSSASAGGSAFTLTVTGSGFLPASVVEWNGSARATSFATPTELQASIPASDIASAGVAAITVTNPPPGGGTSNTLAFTINPSTIFGSAGCGVEATGRANLANDDSQGNALGLQPSISANGRFVSYASPASNLVAGDTNGVMDIFVRDTCNGAPTACLPGTVQASVAAGDGTQANGASFDTALSGTGRFVAFVSSASNLVPDDTNEVDDIFVHDRDTDGNGIFDEPGGVATVRVSVASQAAQGNRNSFAPSLSADGRFVAFVSSASNLVPGDTNEVDDIFVHDRDADGNGLFDEPGAVAMLVVSISSTGTKADGPNATVTFSADGRFVVFESSATNLVLGDTNFAVDIFIAGTCTKLP